MVAAVLRVPRVEKSKRGKGEVERDPRREVRGIKKKKKKRRGGNLSKPWFFFCSLFLWRNSTQ